MLLSADVLSFFIFFLRSGSLGILYLNYPMKLRTILSVCQFCCFFCDGDSLPRNMVIDNLVIDQYISVSTMPCLSFSNILDFLDPDDCSSWQCWYINTPNIFFRVH